MGDPTPSLSPSPSAEAASTSFNTATATATAITAAAASNDAGSGTGTRIAAGAHVGDQYGVPAFEPHSSFESLKERIRHHYELASDYYYSLWGQHIHHAYFLSPTDTKETGQTNLINLLVEISGLGRTSGSTVLDVGCGIGGTTRHLARDYGCSVTGITISGRQVQIAQRLTGEEVATNTTTTGNTPTTAAADTDTDGQGSGGGDGNDDDFTAVGPLGGRVKYIELDAEKMESSFPPSSFDYVWISEALSHFPDKALFFRNAARVLSSGGNSDSDGGKSGSNSGSTSGNVGNSNNGKGNGNGKLVIADWFRADNLNHQQIETDIKPIEDGMLLPPLCTQADYVAMAEAAGLKLIHAPKDISKDVAKTWDISWALVSSPSLWAFAISQGRDGVAFLQAFRAMRRGYANGSFRYAVMAFEKS